MITKILFTLVVIIGVIVFFRVKNEREAIKQSASKVAKEEISSIQPRVLAYIMIGLLVALSTGIYAYHWNQGNRIINIRVTGDSGEVINYQAHHKDINGRDFISLEGVQVTLGDNDRMEILSQ